MIEFKIGTHVRYVGDLGLVPRKSLGVVVGENKTSKAIVRVLFEGYDYPHSCYEDSLCAVGTADPKPEAVAAPAGGMKFDGGKPRWSLLMGGCSKALAGVAAVLTFGAAKYAAHSWKQVENNKERYRDAMYRHLNAIESGEELDPESGLPHWDHIACNALFLSELNKETK